MSDWERVGVVTVDAGTLWLGDPCYFVGKEDVPTKTWKEFVQKLHPYKPVKQWNHPRGHPGLGVTTNTGYGDGVYGVFVKKTPEGRTAEVKVVFVEE